MSEHIIHKTNSAPSCAMNQITDQQSHVHDFLNIAPLFPAEITRERLAGDKIMLSWGNDWKLLHHAEGCCDVQQSQIALLLWSDTNTDSLGKNTWLHHELWVRIQLMENRCLLSFNKPSTKG